MNLYAFQHASEKEFFRLIENYGKPLKTCNYKDNDDDKVTLKELIDKRQVKRKRFYDILQDIGDATVKEIAIEHGKRYGEINSGSIAPVLRGMIKNGILESKQRGKVLVYSVANPFDCAEAREEYEILEEKRSEIRVKVYDAIKEIGSGTSKEIAEKYNELNNDNALTRTIGQYLRGLRKDGRVKLVKLENNGKLRTWKAE